MKFSELRVSAATDSVEPALRFQTTIEVPSTREVVLSVGGALFTADGKRVAMLVEEPGSRLDLLALRLGAAATTEPPSAASVAILTAGLSPRIVDHLARSRDARGDLHLTVNLTFQYASSAAETIRVELGDALPNGKHPVVFQPGKPKEEGRTTWHLLADSVGGSFSVNRVEKVVKLKIHGTDWLHDFAPVLGLGRTAVVEIPRPEDLTASGDLREAVDAALSGLAEAEQHMQARRYDDAMEALRQPAETLGAKSMVGLVVDLLKRDAFTEEAATHFANVLNEQFGLCSKWAHRMDKQKRRINPELHAHEEDVQHVYMTTASMLNMIARKSRRHETPR